MATGSGLLFYQGADSFNEKMDFKCYVQERLTWSMEKWIGEGEENSKMKTFINSVRYWGKKLNKAFNSKNVILTLFDAPGDVAQYLMEIVDAILLIGDDIQLVGFSAFRNTRYLALYFKSEQMKERVEQNLKQVNGKHVAFLSWALESGIKNVSLQWVPWHVDISSLRSEINKYFIIKEECREHRTLLNGLCLPSGMVKFRTLLKPGIDIDQIPQVTEVDGFEALLSVQGKKIECFTCKKKGHKSKNCKEAFCDFCRCLMLKSHTCLEAEKRVKNRAEDNGKDREDGELAVVQTMQRVCVEKHNMLTVERQSFCESEGIEGKEKMLCAVKNNYAVKVLEVDSNLKSINADNDSDMELGLVNNKVSFDSRSNLEIETIIQSADSEDIFSVEDKEENISDDFGTTAIGLVENYLAELNKLSSTQNVKGLDVSNFIKEASSEISGLMSGKKLKSNNKGLRSENLNKTGLKQVQKDKLGNTVTTLTARKTFGKKDDFNPHRTAEQLFDQIGEKG